MQKFLIVVFSVMMIAGVWYSFVFYQETIRPAELTWDHLDMVSETSDVIIIKEELLQAKSYLAKSMANLPEGKNPVFIYPTESTNFNRINHDLDSMIITNEKISKVPRGTSAYGTGIMDIHSRSEFLKKNISDSIPYMYGSLESALSHSILLVGSFGLADILIRRFNQI